MDDDPLLAHKPAKSGEHVGLIVAGAEDELADHPPVRWAAVAFYGVSDHAAPFRLGWITSPTSPAHVAQYPMPIAAASSCV